MTLKRSKKEKKQAKEKAHLDNHSRMDYKKKENKLDKGRQANKMKRETEEYFAEHQPQTKADDEVLSSGSPCDCPAHVHERESPLKVAEVIF